MKLNNKGISLVEIIVSITLISLIMVFWLSVLGTVRHENAQSKQTSQLLVNQSLITKEIYTDFIERELVKVETCQDSGSNDRLEDSVHQLIRTSNNSLAEYQGGNCLKLVYNEAGNDDNIGYLLYYSYAYAGADEVHVMGYRRGNKSVIRETSVPPSKLGFATHKCAGKICTVKINMPVLSEQGDDYGINLSYVSKPGFVMTKNPDQSLNHYSFEIH